MRQCRLLLIGTFAVLVAGCGGSSPPSATNTPVASAAPSTASTPSATTSAAPVGAVCLSKAENRHVVRFPAGNGATLTGVLLGKGSVGVVLAHQVDGDLCQWMPYVQGLVKRGVRVLAFDFEGYGASTVGGDVPNPLGQAVRAAARRLGKAGAERVVLIGASMGGTAVLSAAGYRDPEVAGVVSLSGPATFPGANAKAAVPRIRGPLLLAAARLDQPFAQEARALFGQATSERKKLVLVPGADHGVQLFASKRSVRQAILALLRDVDAARQT